MDSASIMQIRPLSAEQKSGTDITCSSGSSNSVSIDTTSVEQLIEKFRSGLEVYLYVLKFIRNFIFTMTSEKCS